MIKIVLRIIVAICVGILVFPVVGSLAKDVGMVSTWPTLPASVMILATVIASFYAVGCLVSNHD